MVARVSSDISVVLVSFDDKPVQVTPGVDAPWAKRDARSAAAEHMRAVWPYPK